jgi:hypothetical protein
MPPAYEVVTDYRKMRAVTGVSMPASRNMTAKETDVFGRHVSSMTSV